MLKRFPQPLQSALKRATFYFSPVSFQSRRTMAQAPDTGNDKKSPDSAGQNGDKNKNGDSNLTDGINIDIISDNICPWCYVGKRRLDVALSKLPKNVQVNINWLPFELDSNLPLKGVDKRERYRKRFGDRAEMLGQRLAQVGLQCTPPIKFKFGGKVELTMQINLIIQ